MPSWRPQRTWGKSLEQQQRDRDQRYRDARAEAATEYQADIASDGHGNCDGDCECD
jgi:hypothetical protein